MREVVVDTETTGLNHNNGDRVIEVACVELNNHVQTGRTLQFYCNVEKKINEDAVKTHGITNSFLKKHKTFKENAQNLIDFLSSDILIIHNAEFDIGFINKELKLVGYEKINNKVIDTVKLAREKLSTRLASLDFLCRRFSISLEKRKLHGALLDCQLLSEVYLELVGGRQRSFNLDKTKGKNEESSIFIKNNTYKKDTKKISISVDDIKKHKEAIKKISTPLWNKFDY